MNEMRPGGGLQAYPLERMARFLSLMTSGMSCGAFQEQVPEGQRSLLMRRGRNAP